MAEDPQAAGEQRLAARHLLQHPLTVAEADPELFTLIRRHEEQLDRWFTQRLGYRLQVSADTARLSKIGWVSDRPLRTHSGRAFHHLEYVLLVLTLAATIAGPAVVSLRDLVDRVRSAAADGSIDLDDDATQRRAQVAVLKWMIDHGLAEELHHRIDDYKENAEADAVLRTRPDRIAMVPLGAVHGLTDSTSAEEMLAAADRRASLRAWLRARLVEDPVLYRDDLDDDEWDELRRRRGEDARLLEEMFGLTLEARAEGVAAIDHDGRLSAIRFPASGTVGHAALLFIAALHDRGLDGWITDESATELLAELSHPHRSRWKGDLVARPDLLLGDIRELLVSLRLAEARSAPTPGVRLLPGAARFREVVERPAGAGEQMELL